MATAMTLPRSGDGVWYLTPRPAIIIDVPVTNITWTGNAFTFTTEVRVGGLGGRLNGSGVIGDDGVDPRRVHAARRRTIAAREVLRRRGSDSKTQRPQRSQVRQ